MTQPAAPAAATGGALPPLFSGSVYTVLLIAGAVILFVFFVSAAVHLFLRFLSRHRSSPPAATSPHLFLLLRSPSSTSSYSSSATSPRPPPPPPVDVLPLFTLAGSSVAAVPRLALECAVCLSRFRPDEELRLLPACRHAFHSACIEAWISSSLSCPLCRSPIFTEPSTWNPPRGDSSGSFRVEIGSASRRSAAEGQGAPAAALQRTSSLSYSLGSSFEYVVEEDVEAVITALADQVRRQRRSKDLRNPAPAAAPPGDEVAESAGRVGDSRNWLRSYLDRLAPSASSSFSSLRFSARSSRRMDGASPVAAAAVAVAGGGAGWDPEGSSRRRGETEETVSTYYNAFYRWLVGA